MKNYTELLKSELIMALGCTEPISIALAAAKAREVLGVIPSKIEVKCSGNIIKNVKGVTVPNTNGMKGVEAATAIGTVAGDSCLGLEVLSKVTEDDIKAAKDLMAKDIITVSLKEGVENLDIEIVAEDDKKNTVDVEIKNKHTNIVKITKNDDVIHIDNCYTHTPEYENYDELSVKDIYEYANNIDLDEVKDLLEKQITLNSDISDEGLTGKWGVAMGKILIDEDESIRTKAKARAAAGSDARMSGCSLPVVINAGSGNQGITCTMPLVVFANEKNYDRETLYRGLLITNLTALHIKRFIGRLSAFCGVTSAGVAAGAGICYMETKDLDLIEKTIGNALMIASGMICDGAKPSCAAKIATAVDAGISGYYLAKNNRNFEPGDGLLKDDIEETIRSIGYVAKEGMKETDIIVLNTMIQK
ncbi:serine dehydratase subunit alpha family protein [Finegoldia magna]|uniref:L-cysteine desulfidase family protein n=1 Tax=Finegoldia magna TaxID=1260 RepID=UPI000D71B085|nr:L-serine ammonia-lyase, iron-sulfur-dependent, subunit alpha [Finegoldia magna]PWV48051.1 L-cysteine desulfidase [Finegoldia magna]